MVGGICGTAMVRAANAMLAALGGDEIGLLLPAIAMARDAAGQLGLVDPRVREVMVSPVVVRPLFTGNLGPRQTIKCTRPGSVSSARLPDLGMGPAEDLFPAAL